MAVVAAATRCLGAIRAAQPSLNAFISIASDDHVLGLARASDERHARGLPLSEIDGALIAVKDNLCTTTMPTTCASKMLANFTSPFDATPVQRLQKAGAIVVAKTNMDEFGMGSFNLNSAYGPAINPRFPLDTPVVTGGSSGGSAAAIAANLGLFAALGSDTGGSVRLPAAFCQVVGFKPSYGRVSRHGLVAYASSLDTVGVLAPTVANARAIYDVIAGPDAQDSTCLPEAPPQASSIDLKQLHVGIPVDYRIAELSEEALASWSWAIDRLTQLGAKVTPVRLPQTPKALAAYYVLACAEVSSNLARYSGVEYGHRAEHQDQATFHQMIAKSRAEGFGPEVQRRIALGTHCLSRTMYDSYYLNAQRIRAAIRAEFASVFETAQANSVHVLLCPTAPFVAPQLKAAQALSQVAAFAMDVFTVPASLAGLPAISVPTDASGPLGVQLIGPYGREDVVLSVASALSTNVNL
ncbi:glutamyl-tRNA(Gln) amidotransferase subunit A [Capsaspora owczarzaki ATCC 30864]|uniref:Glutamyl-tRNA(Gln) amidotransferase subunit A, mitochondrial n=1 Tax=Capsaspora owczarzaki (strain ATCC 30864) TaxID=595528 RepID=A0A0D2VNQ6_CAPO3|nr:glutamyl-tRNA(Gln) amidotransferase subunit A [Capsaspora owczarzaki ATCC 30864]KJE91987.1 glutamyl-tRNA(Gln) amidotransferase subunit A [Capsaspora owczarzaki ATCC 30864]|eukprot:XP_004363868.1 glutamyl-tRNA(Gln) amidotransferase subunit A [Capsaspora owczarzaki ATCC 30864]